MQNIFWIGGSYLADAPTPMTSQTFQARRGAEEA
jgi:hypothetical protein